MNDKVIYTAIFGKEYYLHEPDVISEGWDYVCFTDNPDLKSDVWDIRVVYNYLETTVLNNRFYKMLPHIHFPDHTESIYIDGDIKIIGNVTEFPKNSDSNFVAFKHNDRHCIYDEAKFIQYLGDHHPKREYKDDMNTVNLMMDLYKLDGYPINNGLILGGLLYRKHMEVDIKEAMERWWDEFIMYSKRDQLSLPYVFWKLKTNFDVVDENINSNKYVKIMKKWRLTQR